MATIRIGADELILWLRKNKKAIDIPNDEIHGLGIKIHNIMVDELRAKKLDDEPCYWANLDIHKNIGKKNLPKTATQYEIETSDLGRLYEKLNAL